MTYRGHQPDYFLISISLILVLFGLIILSSASAPAAYQKFGDPYYFVKHQLVTGLIPGLILFFFFANFYYEKLKKLALPLLIGSIVILTLVFIPGIRSEYGTARSWLNIFGFSIQPAEVVKLTFLIYLAAWLAGRGETRVRDFRTSFLPFIIVLGVISLLMVLQPDIGTLSIIILSALVVYFVGGGSISHLVAVAGIGLLGFLILIKATPYRLNRFVAFLHPEKDPQGIAYHVWQSLIAIGSGGLFGLGFGHSRQKFSYLPEPTGDSIFSIMAEELGFFVATFFVVVLLLLAYRCLKLAKGSPDRFSRLLVIGIISSLIFQAFINIAAMLSLFPITGIPLPFVSAGGTSLMVSLSAMGILVNISKFSKI